MKRILTQLVTIFGWKNNKDKIRDLLSWDSGSSLLKRKIKFRYMATLNRPGVSLKSFLLGVWEGKPGHADILHA